MKVYPLILFLILFFSLAKEGDAGGISTTFTEVVVRDLSVGKNYAMGKKLTQQLRVRNRGELPIELKMEVLMPSKNELKEGYEPIPDPSWIELEKDYFSVEPSKDAVTDLIITIPNDKKHLGKKYQAFIWSHTAGKGAMPIVLGLKSRLLIEISEKERDLSQEFPGKFDFAILPDEMVLKDIELGKFCDIKKLFGKVLQVKNLSQFPQDYEIRSISLKTAIIGMGNVYEVCPDPDFLTFARSKFSLKRNKKTRLEIYLGFPKIEQYAGKKYLFVARIRLLREEFILNRYLKIYVTTAKEF